MEYYNPNDNNIKRNAAVITFAVLALLFTVAFFISFTVIPSERIHALVDVKFTETVDEVIEEDEEKPEKPNNTAVGETTPTATPQPDATVTKSQESAGSDETTQTPDPEVKQQALFTADVVGTTTTDTVNTTNPASTEGQTTKRGEEDDGPDSWGNDGISFGKDLKARVVGKPAKPNFKNAQSVSVIVVLTVTVNINGEASAVFTRHGSANCTEDDEYVRAAMDALNRTKFSPAERETHDIITYEFVPS